MGALKNTLWGRDDKPRKGNKRIPCRQFDGGAVLISRPVAHLLPYVIGLFPVRKPVCRSAQRHWTQTSALNDADEIAGTILMHSLKETA